MVNDAVGVFNAESDRLGRSRAGLYWFSGSFCFIILVFAFASGRAHLSAAVGSGLLVTAAFVVQF